MFTLHNLPYKIKLGKDERYLKDDHELNQYLLSSALQHAELFLGEGQATLLGRCISRISKIMQLIADGLRISARFQRPWTLRRFVH
jgi:hypothetical protein